MAARNKHQLMMTMLDIKDAFKANSTVEMTRKTLQQKMSCSGCKASLKSINDVVAAYGDFFVLSANGTSVRLVPSTLRTHIVRANGSLIYALAKSLAKRADFINEFDDLKLVSALINERKVAFDLPMFIMKVLQRANYSTALMSFSESGLDDLHVALCAKMPVHYPVL